uniref:Uncharacterized protein n=1 Tax=Anopheles arabiensis TaxID=7173 RepID=A0A182HJQ5_ANOAR
MYDRTAGTFSFDPTRPTVVAANDMVQQRPRAKGDLCKPLNCKKKELCLLEDAYTAVCVSKKELHKNKEEIITKSKYFDEEEAKRKAEAEAAAAAAAAAAATGLGGAVGSGVAGAADTGSMTLMAASGDSSTGSNANDGTSSGLEHEEREDDESSSQDDDVFYDSEKEEDCKPCPVVKPTYLCGSDNWTYSSLCRLEYHNCIHTTEVKVNCMGFCPCK